MKSNQYRLTKPKFRSKVKTKIEALQAYVTLDTTSCSFGFEPGQQPAISHLFSCLMAGNMSEHDLIEASPEVAEQVPQLIDDLFALRFLCEGCTDQHVRIMSGTQLYREVSRMADQIIGRFSKSLFYNGLVDNHNTRDQMIGYALEYWWIVNNAAGLIGAAMSGAHSYVEQAKIQDYLKSELGHDKFLAKALISVGITDKQLHQHQPLPSTFSLCAALGVYAKQHTLSFKACLFLFERAQPDFIVQFENHCKFLDLPEEFYLPLRAHADINDDYDHGDISRELMSFHQAVDEEECSIVKRNVFIMVETLLEQEKEIIDYYGGLSARIPRIFI
jgi:hypothetical protein